MNCQDVDQHLCDYFFESLAPSGVEAVETHLRSGCPACRSALDSIALASTAPVGSLEPRDPPKKVKLDLMQKIRNTPQVANRDFSNDSHQFLSDHPNLLHSEVKSSGGQAVELASSNTDGRSLLRNTYVQAITLTVACCFLAGYLGYKTSGFHLGTHQVATPSDSSGVDSLGELDTQKVTDDLVATTSMQFISVKKSDIRTSDKRVDGGPSASDPQVLTGYVAYDAMSRQLHVGFRFSRDSLPIERIRCTAVDSLANEFELGELRPEANDFLTGVFDLTGAQLPIQKLLLSDWNKPMKPRNDNDFQVSIRIVPFGTE